MKIYTKTGDAGQTGLLGGPRVSKDAARIEAYGTVDELNSLLGLARTESLPRDLDEVLQKIQNQLFDLGAELASPGAKHSAAGVIGPEHVGWQEKTIDRYESQLAPLDQFILPGGTKAAALLHVARCACRRAERRVVTLSAAEPLRPDVLVYLNRLSDLLFVLARAANHAAGSPDVVWQKEA